MADVPQGKPIYATAHLLYDRFGYDPGDEIQHLPPAVLEKLLDRGEASTTKPRIKPKPQADQMIGDDELVNL